MSPSGCAVIINRLSGSYSEKKVEYVRTFLYKQGLAPSIHVLQDFLEVLTVTRQICKEHHNPIIIVGGGDGTINGVLNSINPGVATLAALPFGTSNVLTRELGIQSMEGALHRIARGNSRLASVGLIEKDSVRKYFLLMAGIGFDGFIVKGVRVAEKRLFGKAAYAISTLRHFLNWEQDLMMVTAGTGTLECHSLIVCNAARYAGKFRIAPGASLFEPELEVICIKNPARKTYLEAAANLLTGRGFSGKDISTFRTREVEVSGNKPVQVDGDFYCHSPVKISIATDFVKLIV